MDYCILRKVPFRLPGTKRLVWAVIVAECEGLNLLFVQRPDRQRSHTLVIGTENVAERVFEEAKANQFPMEQSELMALGRRLQAIGDNLREDEFTRRWLDDCRQNDDED